MNLKMDEIWWRVWEFTSGAAIGLGFGIAFVFLNRRESENIVKIQPMRYSNHPNAEKLFGIYFAYFFGLGWSIHQAIQGHFDIYSGNTGGLIYYFVSDSGLIHCDLFKP